MTAKFVYSLVLLAVAGGAYVAGSWHAPRGTVVAAESATSRPILYYHCPMHAHVRSGTPGTTPCCGMLFEPVYADPASAAETGAAIASAKAIEVSASRQQLAGITVGSVEEASGIESIRVFGRVTPDETRIHRLTAGLEAYISEASSVTTGSRVSKDQWLASYSTPDARLPIAAFITAVNVLEREERNGNPDSASLAAARTSVALGEDRLRTMGMSPVQIEEIRRSRAAVTTVKLTSPVDGFVLARNVTSGQRFDQGTELFRLADLRRVWIVAEVPAGTADHFAPGTEADVTVAGRPTGVRARVSRTVRPLFDAVTQAFTLRLEADNLGFALRPDMFVDVHFEVAYDPALLVPADAVVRSGLHSRVFVEHSAGIFEPREVELGRRHGTRIAVSKGLAPGDRIATSGTFLLDSESRMKSHSQPPH